MLPYHSGRRGLLPLLCERWLAEGGVNENTAHVGMIEPLQIQNVRGAPKMVKYDIYGEFEVPRKKAAHGKRVLDNSKEALNDFWTNVESVVPGLSTARGCYIFSIRAGKGFKPWYVGQSKTGFLNECFTPHKVNHYHDVINDITSGTPVLVFVSRLTSGGNFSKKYATGELAFIEKQLISIALSKNTELKNIKNTKFPKSLQIPGILNSPAGKPGKGASLLRRVLTV